MCNRYTVTGRGIAAKRQRDYLVKRFGASEVSPGRMSEADWAEIDRLGSGRYNVAPSQEILVVEQTEDGHRRLAVRKWGVQRSGRPWMNARDDQLEKQWAGLLKPGRRILIPADGWYEWTKPERPKGPGQPWHFTVDDGGYFAFAGLANPSEAVIVTTRPNRIAAPIHDRMPAVLASEEIEQAWLDPGVSPEEAVSLIEPIEDGRVRVRPVSERVNSWQNDGPELLDPANAPVSAKP